MNFWSTCLSQTPPPPTRPTAGVHRNLGQGLATPPAPGTDSLETSSDHSALGAAPWSVSSALPRLAHGPLGTLRHLGQIRKGQSFPRQELCLSALSPWFSSPGEHRRLGQPGLRSPAPNGGHFAGCSQLSKPAFFSSLFCLFKIKRIIRSAACWGGSQLHQGGGRLGAHLAYSGSVTLPASLTWPRAPQGPGRLLAVALGACWSPPPFSVCPPTGKQVSGFPPPQPRASSGKTLSYLCRDFRKRFLYNSG